MRHELARRGTQAMREERGITLMIALFVMIIVMGFGLAAVGQAISANGVARRDTSSKTALQAADAGMQVALFRLNSLAQYLANPADTALYPCVNAQLQAGQVASLTVSVAVTGVAPNQWCVPGPWEPMGNGESYQIQMTPAINLYNTGVNLDRRIIVTGRVITPDARTVYRRIEQTVSSTTGSGGLFAVAGVVSDQDLNISGSVVVGSPALHDNVLSNQNVTISGAPSVCGNITYGPTATESGRSSCAGTTVTQETRLATLPTVSPPSNPQNSLICPGGCPQGVSYDATARVLSVGANSSLTLTPGNYIFCQVNLSGGGSLVISAVPATPTVIYIDTPSNCGGSSGISVLGHASIVTPPGLTDGGQVQIQAAGTSTIDIGGTALVATLSIVAPSSSVTVHGNVQLTGAILGRTVTLSGNPTIMPAAKLTGVGGGGASALFTRKAFGECPAGAGSPNPDSGC